MRPPRMRRLLPLLPLVALAGCSGTPFGDQLSRSFSTPPAASPSLPPAVRPAAPAPAAPAKPTDANMKVPRPTAPHTLRRTLGEDGDRVFVRTVSRHGYQFVCPVVEEEDGGGTSPSEIHKIRA